MVLCMLLRGHLPVHAAERRDGQPEASGKEGEAKESPLDERAGENCCQRATAVSNALGHDGTV
jgi:hypothetical protein